MTCILIATLIVATYIIIMCCKCKEIPLSVSDTYYKGGGIWFTVVMFICGILCSAGLLSMTEGSAFQFISFLTGAGMCFVGAAPNFKDDKMVHNVHFTGAYVLLIGTQLWNCIFATPWLLLLWIPGLYWIFTKQYMFWLEITCILSIIAGIFLI